MPETKIVIGGETNASLDSAVDRAKAKARELANETKLAAVESIHWADEQVKHHLEFEAVVHGVSHVVQHGWAQTANAIRSGMRYALADIAPKVATALGSLGLLYGSVKILGGAMWLLDKASGAAQQGLGGFTVIESLTTRLKPLTGSVEAARLKLGELAGTFKGTNVTLPDATDAYRAAHLGTGGVLSDSAGLTMLGDVATGSGNGIKETSAAVSTLYADLQAGRPVKEAADQLQNMNIISAETRARMDGMQASGKTGAEVWTMLSGEFKKSAGAMAEARDNLTSLQQAVVQARADVYTKFAEASVPGEKKNLRDRAAVFEKLQPAAEEAGDLFGKIGGSASFSTQATNIFYDGLLSRMGDLRKWVDLLGIAGTALVSFAVVGVVGAAASLVTLGAVGLAAVASIGGIAAVLGGGAAALVIWTAHNDRANKAQKDLMDGTDSLVAGLRKEGAAITSVTDKALALGKAYDLYKQARDAASNAKTPAEREELELRARAIGREITRLERKDESTLKPSAERESAAKIAQDAGHERSEATSTFREKLAAAEAELKDARQKQYQARQALEDPALQGNGPGAVQRREAARTALTGADAAVDSAETEVTKQRAAVAAKDARLEELAVETRIAALESQGITRAREEWAIKRDQLTAQVAAAEAGRDELKAAEARNAINQGDAALKSRETAAADQQRELAVEMQIASLQGDSVARLQQESQLRLGLIEARWKEAEAVKDTGEMDKQRLAYFQEQRRLQGAIDSDRAGQRDQDLSDAVGSQAENRKKRELEAQFARREITAQQKRDAEVQMAFDKQDALNAEAQRIGREADAQQAQGNTGRAEELRTQAVRKQQESESAVFDAAALDAQPLAAGRPVADSLARLGLGGNVAPPGFDALRTGLDRLGRNSEEMKAVLIQIRDKPNDTVARFSR